MYFGNQKCSFKDPISKKLYNGLSWNHITCKLEIGEINYFNATTVGTGFLGRPFTDRQAYLVNPDENLYVLKTKSVIKSVSPQKGSVLGGTYLTITGSYLNSETAFIEISGTQCLITGFESKDKVDSKLICMTMPKPDSYTLIGDSGISVIEDNTFTSSQFLQTAVPSIDAKIYKIDGTTYRSNYGSKTVWMKGYFTPLKTSKYKFNLVVNSNFIFYMSKNENPLEKEVLI